jgi:hypothetical protein
MDPAAVAARLREACRLMARPIVVPDPTPTPAQVEARLREACALWVACAELALAGAAIPR